jgi:hypothetical protein
VAVALEIRAPRASVGQPDGSVRDTLNATILAVDLKKKTVTRRVNRQAEVVVPVPRPSPSGDVTYHLVMAIDVPPGQYQLRTSAASARLQRAGSVYLTVDVPAAPKPGPVIAGLAVGLAGGGSTAVSQKAEGPLPIRPVFDRVFRQTDTLRIVYWIARREPTAVSSYLDIVNAQDQVVLSVEGPRELGLDGMVDLEVPLATLFPGGYRLRVTAGEGARIATREIGFAIRDGSP